MCCSPDIFSQPPANRLVRGANGQGKTTLRARSPPPARARPIAWHATTAHVPGSSYSPTPTAQDDSRARVAALPAVSPTPPTTRRLRPRPLRLSASATVRPHLVPRPAPRVALAAAPNSRRLRPSLSPSIPWIRRRRGALALSGTPVAAHRRLTSHCVPSPRRADGRALHNPPLHDGSSLRCRPRSRLLRGVLSTPCFQLAVFTVAVTCSRRRRTERRGCCSIAPRRRLGAALSAMLSSRILPTDHAMLARADLLVPARGSRSSPPMPCRTVSSPPAAGRGSPVFVCSSTWRRRACRAGRSSSSSRRAEPPRLARL